MADDLKNFRLLCDCLSVDQSPEAVAALRNDVVASSSRWKRILELADQEMIAPALWSALEKKELLQAVPEAVCASLKRRHLMNSLLNKKIKQEAIELINRCNEIGVVPIMLKGGVHLFESSPRTFGSRVMRDLDFMIPEDRFAPVIALLSSMGYRLKEEEADYPNYCYPAMERPNAVAPIELHRFVGQQGNILLPEQAWADAVSLPAKEVNLLALSPTHRVFHNIFHSQVQDRGQELGLPWLRQLYDLSVTCRRHADSIDWVALDRLMAGAGLRPALHCRLHLANRLLSLPLPPVFEPSLRARTHYTRCMLMVRWTGAMRLVRLWASITDPFKKYRIDLIYNCGTNPIKLNFCRLQYAWYVLRKYEASIPALLTVIWKRRHYDV